MKNITFFLLLLLPTIIFAQATLKPQSLYKVKSGTPYPVIDAKEKYYFSFEDDILMIKITKKNIYLQKYNTSTEKQVKVKILPALEKRAYTEKLIKLNNKIYLFYSLYDKKNIIEQLFYREINPVNLSMGSSKKIISVKDKITGHYTGSNWFNMHVEGKFNIYSSFNKSKFVVQYRKRPKERKDKINHDVIGIFVFDKEFNKIWGKEIKMPYTEAKMNNIDYQVDDKGIVYLLAEVYNTDVVKKYIHDTKNYHLELLKIDNGALETIKLDEGKNNITDAWMYDGPKGNIYLSGFYSKDKYWNKADGVFLIKILDDGTVENTEYYEIPLSVLNMYQKERTQKKNKKKKNKGKLDFENLELREVHVQSDGSIIIIGEQHYIIEHTYTDSKGNTHTTYTYYYNDILVTKIAKDGELAWMKKLPKSQRGGAGLGGMSFKYIKQGNYHYFFYLDNIKNIDLPTNKRPAFHMDGKGGIYTAYRLDDETGEVKKTSILDFANVKINGYKKPQKLYQFSKTRVFKTSQGVVFEAYKKKKEDVMIRIDIND